MLRSGQPSRPSAMTCCCLCSLNTLLTSREGPPPLGVNILLQLRWPVFRRPSLASSGLPPMPFLFGCVCFVRSRPLPSGGGVRPFRSLLLSLRSGDKAGTCPAPRASLLAGRAGSTIPLVVCRLKVTLGQSSKLPHSSMTYTAAPFRRGTRIVPELASTLRLSPMALTSVAFDVPIRNVANVSATGFHSAMTVP